jgi:thiopurine S-methyltransferase
VEKSFWVERWATGQIGFHQGAPHPFLVEHHATIAASRRIYVPLCGKAVDLPWLRDRGHDVVGSEIVPAALAALLAEQGLAAASAALTSSSGAPFVHHRVTTARAGAGRLDLLEGDAFAVDRGLLAAVYGDVRDDSGVDAVFDRAALVALDPPTRAVYVERLRAVLRPGGRILLVTFGYDQTKLPGPPWSVDDDTVRTLFADGFVAERLAVRDEPLGPKFLAAGVTRLTEACWLLELRP